MKSQKVSVIIPAFNEEEDIGECLKSLGKQSYKDFEVIVVDDGSNDKTGEVVRKFKGVRLIKGEHKGAGYSRNLGAKLAKGDILVFVDADITFDKYYIENLIAPILNDKEGKIIGTSHELELGKNIENIWSRCWRVIRIPKQDAENSDIFRAIRKDKFLELGGFDQKYGAADDRTFWYKYKIKAFVAKNTISYHKNPKTLKEVYKQSRWYGASIDNFFLRVPVIKYLSPLFLAVASPLMIPFFSFRKCSRNKDFVILPWMLIFMAVRYFGSIAGIFRKIYLDVNVR